MTSQRTPPWLWCGASSQMHRWVRRLHFVFHKITRSEWGLLDSKIFIIKFTNILPPGRGTNTPLRLIKRCILIQIFSILQQFTNINKSSLEYELWLTNINVRRLVQMVDIFTTLLINTRTIIESTIPKLKVISSKIYIGFTATPFPYKYHRLV